MSKVTGRIQATSKRPTKNGAYWRHSVKVNGVWYAAGLSDLQVAKGSWVEFDAEDGKYGWEVQGVITPIEAPGADFSGTVERISSKEVVTKYGTKPVYGICVGGTWFNLGFTKPDNLEQGCSIEGKYSRSQFGNDATPGSLVILAD